MVAPVAGSHPRPAPLQNSPMPALHRQAFVMDGHTHVMTRELLMHTDIGQRYPDGNVDLPRAKEGGVDAMFFSVYTPENYYPGRFEIKNTFRVVELALSPEKLAIVNDAGERVHEPGTFVLTAAGSSPGARSLALGAAEPVHATLELER